jgi:hypothetical protein
MKIAFQTGFHTFSYFLGGFFAHRTERVRQSSETLWKALKNPAG